MSEPRVLFVFRPRLFTLAEELGNVSEARRLIGGAPLRLVPLDRRLRARPFGLWP